jgi:hypothetical protein
MDAEYEFDLIDGPLETPDKVSVEEMKADVLDVPLETQAKTPVDQPDVAGRPDLVRNAHESFEIASLLCRRDEQLTRSILMRALTILALGVKPPSGVNSASIRASPIWEMIAFGSHETDSVEESSSSSEVPRQNEGGKSADRIFPWNRATLAENRDKDAGKTLWNDLLVRAVSDFQK